MVVFFMCFEMICQVADPLGQERDLHFGRTRICFVLPEIGDNLLFSLRVQGHFLFSFLVRAPVQGVRQRGVIIFIGISRVNLELSSTRSPWPKTSN